MRRVMVNGEPWIIDQGTFRPACKGTEEMLPTELIGNMPTSASQIVNDAEKLADLCNEAYRLETGKENTMRRRYANEDTPVVVVGSEAGYWSLKSNDPDIDRDTFRNIAITIRSSWK